MPKQRRETVQIPLDLGHRTAQGRKDFIAAPCNENALLWIDRWPDWPATGLSFYGSPGCGKTHLAEIWRVRSGATKVAAMALRGRDAAEIISNAPALVIENINADVPEQTLLHLYNLIGERNGHILFTGLEAPGRMGFRLPDLLSRLRAMPAISIADPDDMVLSAVMRKMFEDRQLLIGEEIISFLLARMERSFSAARSIAAEIDRLALAEQRQITIPLARLALAEAEGR
ncbi:MAG: DnaA/Hda family protein [Proteobacteria bacterium]|nr:DnaA/Hda family protein [Pseudomonadota bacterium]MDA1357423.1 DnaA/Hda family protein [Pseudomonadota bacterium]